MTCQTKGLKRPGSDYIGNVARASSGLPCVQWNLVPFDTDPDRYKDRLHNKCRNTGYKYAGNQDEGPFVLTNGDFGAYCYTADTTGKVDSASVVDSSGKKIFQRTYCMSIPGISFAPILKIELD